MEAAEETIDATTDEQADEGLSNFMNECARRIEADEDVSDLFGVDSGFVDNVVLKAFQLYEAGQFDQAQVLLEGACALEPNRSYARLLRGDVYLRRGKLRKAREQFEKAHELDGDDLMTTSKLGEACLQTGEQERAIELLERVLEEADAEAPYAKRAEALLDTVDSG